MNKKKEPITPWHDAKGRMHFPYRALESMAFIWPAPPPEKFGDSNILIPIQYQKYYAEGWGILLSIGPGYWNQKGRWFPVDPLLKPGTMVAYDHTVPWSIMLDGPDGKTHEVVRCVEADIGGVEASQFWSVYIVECNDGSLYCGVSNNIEKRIATHNAGLGAKYTKARRPVILQVVSRPMTKSDALKLEHKVKKQKKNSKIPFLREQ